MKLLSKIKAKAEEKKEKKLKNKEREKYHKEVLKFEKEHHAEEKKAPEGAYISLRNINKIYDNHIQAVYDFNLDINKNEFIVFVGPSGCGKSTTLRMIAGLEDITSGDLFIDGVYSNDLTPKERDISMVFQSYALFPNMTVYENIGFGLKIAHTDKKELDERVRKAADILQLTDYLDRKPANLSGGQMQRVALGRAIVKDSKLFLMDEPLSNLDAKLRVAMRSEIVDLHNKIGSTTIYVTHDQTEAMTMATRIVVMNKGFIQQIGTPKEIYNHPANKFVASFVGSPAMNMFDVSYKDHALVFSNGYKIATDKDYDAILSDFYRDEIKANEDWVASNKGNGNEALAASRSKEKEETIERLKIALDSKQCLLTFGIRPEGIKVHQKPSEGLLERDVVVSELLGSEYYLHFRFDDKAKLVAKAPAEENFCVGDKVYLEFVASKMHIFDPVTGKTIGE